jgi:4-amino-4-deoxy-L-arabinose transferase-like glycosyltransferase
MIKALKPIWPFLLASFLIFSAPFIHYPITDADCLHWIKISADLHRNWAFLTGINDQAHGPLLSWVSALFSAPFPTSNYSYGLFNILIGVAGVALAYFLAKETQSDPTNTPVSPTLAAFMASTSLATVYLSHTPMYDWPAAIFYAAGCLFWLKNKKVPSAILFGLGTLCRFSIVFGLATFFITLLHLQHKKSLKRYILDGLLVTSIVFLINTPWWIGQWITHGMPFVSEFLFDNFIRFIHEAPNAPIQRDYYGFSLYAALGIFPYTAIGFSLLQHSVWKRVKTHPKSQALLAMWVPCLVIFSTSGHIKLGRYIAYIFIPLLVWIATEYAHVYSRKATQRLTRLMNGGFLILLALLLGITSLQFQAQSTENPLLVYSIIGLTVSLSLLGVWITDLQKDAWVASPHRFLVPFIVIYSLFFGVLAWLTPQVSFLAAIQSAIHTLTQ